MLPALEERDHKIVNNPIEAHIIAEVCHLYLQYNTFSCRKNIKPWTMDIDSQHISIVRLLDTVKDYCLL